jgi:hypothetical protein
MVDCLGGPGFGHTECLDCGARLSSWSFETHPDYENVNAPDRYDETGGDD